MTIELLLILSLLAQPAKAQMDASFAISSRQAAMNQFKEFQPEKMLPQFNPTPAESSIVIGEGEEQVLNALGERQAKKDATTQFVIEQEKKRTKVNSSSQTLDYAERLLEHPEQVLEAKCQKVPVPCEEKVEQKECEEHTSYQSLNCQRLLTISLKQTTSTITRVPKAPFSLDLTRCDGEHEVLCTESNLIHLPSNCEHIDVNIHSKEKSFPLTKAPTCEDPTLTFNVPSNPPRLLVKIDARIWVSESSWQETPCAHEHCELITTNTCLEPHQAKVIDGILVTRPCWGFETSYRCIAETTNNCQPLIDANCTLSQTTCTNDTCDSKTFSYQCVTKTCFPDKEICQSAIPCAAGECDLSHDEESEDAQEGIGRLGTLAGVAEEVAKKQVDAKTPSIFEGTYQECEKYPLGLRDCCTDSGFLEGLIHCPKDLQILQRAKVEGRVFSLGRYKHGTLGTTHYGFCVFPTKLSSIIQIEGRLHQLGISFGNAKFPDCRGITVSELSRIDFGRLHIEPLIDEMVAKTKLPDDRVLQEKGANEVTRRTQESDGQS